MERKLSAPQLPATYLDALKALVISEEQKQLAEAKINELEPKAEVYDTIANTRGLLMKAPVVSDSKVLVHTENGILYIMGRLSSAEITDLDNVLQKVGNVSKIVTLIDNIDQASGTVESSAVATPMMGSTVTTQPLVETPVAIDPDQPEPVITSPTTL